MAENIGKHVCNILDHKSDVKYVRSIYPTDLFIVMNTGEGSSVNSSDISETKMRCN
jgi:hypothetical protein